MICYTARLALPGNQAFLNNGGQMRGVRIPHDLNGEDRFLLGLSVTSLAVLLFSLLAAYTVLHIPWPAPIRIALATVLGGVGAAIAWVRPEGRSLVHWLGAALEYWFSSYRESPEPQAAPSAPPRLSVIEPVNSPVLDFDAVDPTVLELPVSDTRRQYLSPQSSDDSPGDEPTPVYLGGSQIIAFFSIKGGTGRTTLATEMACLLAARGWYRESPRARPARLKVALVDLDLGSANVSVRIGLAQPTVLDYVMEAAVKAPHLPDYLLRHDPSGLQVLLGMPKCMTASATQPFGVPQCAEILAALNAEGYHFVFVDVGASLSDLTAHVLAAAGRVLYIVTPTAGSIQDLYRGVEALRRLGLGPKLRYVANKMREPWDLSEPMGDLGGTIVARIPYDTAFEAAENRHHPFVLHGKGETMRGLVQLGQAIYPGLALPDAGRVPLGRLRWFGRPRHAS